MAQYPISVLVVYGGPNRPKWLDSLLNPGKLDRASVVVRGVVVPGQESPGVDRLLCDLVINTETADEGRLKQAYTGTPIVFAPKRGLLSGEILHFGRLVMDLSSRVVFVDGRPVNLPPKEFELLRILAKHRYDVISTEALFREIWGEFGDRSTVKVHVGRLRRKIEVNPSRPRYIITVRGYGYRFSA